MKETDSLRCSVCSEIGPVKRVNEDSFFAAMDAEGRQRGLFAVADGVSGSSHGEIASGICVRELERAWGLIQENKETGEQYAVQLITEALLRANAQAWKTRQSEDGGSSSTLSLLLLWEGCVHLLHVGDSRIYCLRRSLGIGKLKQLTEDHACMVQRERDGHSYRKSILTRSIGRLPDAEYQYESAVSKAGDGFLLCSDGLIKTGTERELKRALLRARREDECARKLVEQVLQKGEKDNITAVYVEIKEQ